MLRLEGLALFLGMTLLYWVWDGSWWVYAALFLAPDLSFLAYIWGPRFGAAPWPCVRPTSILRGRRRRPRGRRVAYAAAATIRPSAAGSVSMLRAGR